MEAIVIATTLVGSFATAFLIQRMALEAFVRALSTERRVRR